VDRGSTTTITNTVDIFYFLCQHNLQSKYLDMNSQPQHLHLHENETFHGVVCDNL